VTVTHPTWQRTKPDTDDEHTGWAFAGPNDPPFTSSTGEQPTHGSELVPTVVPKPHGDALTLISFCRESAGD